MLISNVAAPTFYRASQTTTATGRRRGQSKASLDEGEERGERRLQVRHVPVVSASTAVVVGCARRPRGRRRQAPPRPDTKPRLLLALSQQHTGITPLERCSCAESLALGRLLWDTGDVR